MCIRDSPCARRRDAEGRAERGRDDLRGTGVADEQTARAFGHSDDRRNQPARPRDARGRHQGKGDCRVAVRREAGDSAGRQPAGLGGCAGGSAREIEGSFRETDFRGAATGARGEMKVLAHGHSLFI